MREERGERREERGERREEREERRERREERKSIYFHFFTQYAEILFILFLSTPESVLQKICEDLLSDFRNKCINYEQSVCITGQSKKL